MVGELRQRSASARPHFSRVTSRSLFPTFHVAGFLAVRHDEERVVKTAYTPQLFFFVFHKILAGMHSLSTGKSTFALVGDSHFDTVGNSSQPFKFLAIQRDRAVAAPIPLPA
jgi:hypothetical protein